MNDPLMTLITRISEQVRGHLSGELARINAEIGRYPTPIAGCDQQFNYLLDQRNALKGELARFDGRAGEAATGDDARRAIVAFVRNCTCMEPETKAALLGSLASPPRESGPGCRRTEVQTLRNRPGHREDR